MHQAKFSMNALVLIAILFSALAFFVTGGMGRMADRRAVNDFIPIEGTEYAIRYSSLSPNGLCRGTENANTLLLEGTFGADWGACAQGDDIYLNEYTTTDLGLLLCDVVKIDLTTMTKTILFPDSVLRGRCSSGELVVVSGCLLPADFPATDSLCRLYRLTARETPAEQEGGAVLFLDPRTLEEVWRVEDPHVFAGDFEARYLSRALSEVMA